MGSLGTQTALARAAMLPDATSAVVRGLAQALGGWAAYLPSDATPETFWPTSAEASIPLLRAETLRLNRTGAHSAATFELHGQPVVEYPISSNNRIHGFLAIGPGRTLTAADRQVIVTVCTLLAMRAKQREAVSGATAALGSAVAKLLLHGQPEAARMLAEDVGLHDLPTQVRLLGLRLRPGDDVLSLVRAVPSLRRDGGVPPVSPAEVETVLRHEEEGALLLILLAEENGPRRSTSLPPGDDLVPDGPAGVLSQPVLLGELAGAFASVRRALPRAPAGCLISADADHGHDALAQTWVKILADYPRSDLIGTVTAYLRHRGHWENASRELGAHRNSVRHRIGVARSLLGVDLDDPDVLAPLWLALRHSGR